MRYVYSDYDRYRCEKIRQQYAQARYSCIGKGLHTTRPVMKLKNKFVLSPHTYVALQRMKHEESWSWVEGMGYAREAIEVYHREQQAMERACRKAYVQHPVKIT